MIQKSILVTTALLALAAAFICNNLLNKHITGSSGVSWFEAGCSDQTGPGKANCAKVLASPYSYFPPKWPDKPDGAWRLPTAFLGLVYYSTVFVWLIGVGRPSHEKRGWHLPPLVFVGIGLLGSAYFMFIMYRVLDEWCPWCLVTHVLNLLIAVGLILMWPRRKRPADLPEGAPSSLPFQQLDTRDRFQHPPMSAPHPSVRTLIVTLLAVVVVINSNMNSLGMKSWKFKSDSFVAAYKNCVDEVNRIKNDSEKLFKNWQLAEQRTITRRPDDPVRTFADPASGTLLDVVVFSDFECPSCQRFAEFFERRVPPLFEGHVRLTFKHYPIDQTCNPQTLQTLHRFACFAVSQAEAARTLKGNDGFWKVHDFFYKNRVDLAAGKITPERIAEVIGVDASAFRQALQSSNYIGRVSEDAEQAKSCEIRGTPGVFVEGRQVNMLAVTEIGFWDKIADMYWHSVEKPRPAATRPSQPAAIPNSPGPTTAP